MGVNGITKAESFNYLRTSIIIKIHNMNNLNEKQKVKITSALSHGEAVLDSPLWATKITKAVFTESNGYTGAQIVNLIRSGSHDGGEADEVLDINIEGFYRRSNIVGYTFLGSLTQWINRRFLDNYGEADIFHHVMHETMHRSFRFRHTKIHSTSVPYLVGKLSGIAFKEFYSRPHSQLFNFIVTNPVFEFVS